MILIYLRPFTRNVRIIGKAQRLSNVLNEASRQQALSQRILMLPARSYASMSSQSHPKFTTVSFDLKDPRGNITKVHVQPSYPEKPKAVANLIAALPDLITDAVMPTERISNFSTTGWDLDESNDTIHRYIELESKSDVESVLQQVRIVSEELNHDPHIYQDGQRFTISCTTHVPAGLSMKDIKLARKINEILVGIQRSQTIENDEAEILTQRQRAREHNMEEIRKAKLRCDCG